MSVSRRLGAMLRLSFVLTVIVTLVWVASAAIATGPASGMRLLAARAGHTATVQGDGSLLIAGGAGNRGLVANVEFFDPVSGKATLGPALIEPRSSHSAIELADGRVLLAGGRNASKQLMTSTEIYDPTNGMLSAGAALRYARANHTTTLLADGRVLVAGGDANGTAEIYDPATGRFQSVGRLAVARAGHAAMLLGGGRVLLVGGYDAAGATAEIFDAATNTFSAVRGGLKTARVQPTLKLLSDGKVQVYGGDAEITMEIYNPAGYFSSRGHLLRDSSMFRSIMYSPGQAALVAIPAPQSRHYAEEALGPAGDEFERAGHTATEVAAKSTLVVVGGVGATGRALDTISEIGTCSGTVTTDLTDYYPGQTVVMSGSGWTPGDQITLNLHRDTNDPPDTTLFATADENGDWINSDYVVQEFDLGVTFVLTATGDSGCVAQTTFTDSGQFSYLPSTQALTIAPGNSDTFTQSVTAPKNNGNVTATVLVTGTGTPIPAGWVSTNPTSLTFATGDSHSPDVTLSWVVTVAVPAGTAAGTYTANITASAPGSGIGDNKETKLTVTVTGLSNQTITFGPLANKTFGDPDFGVSATASSGLTVSFSSLTTSTCTVSGTTVHIVAAGLCTIRASQAGNASFNPAPNVDQSFTILSDQTITFAPLANKTFGDPDFAVSATASSGLTVSFSSLTTSACTVSGTTVHIVAAGLCTIRASQAGNASYNPAPNVDRSFTINKATATITVTPYSVTYDGASHTATGTAKGVLGETLAGLDLSGTAHTNAGNFTDTWNFTDVTGNYNNDTGTVNDVIAKANATITVTPYSVTYDAMPHTATGSATGVPSGALAGLNLSGTTHTNAGTYNDTWTFTDVTGNYNNASGQITDVIGPRKALVRYIGQQTFVTSGTSSTTAQVHLTASVQDPTGVALVGAKIDFIDTSTGQIMAGGITVTPVFGSPANTGTADAIVTLSTGQFGAQLYVILVRMTGNYTNKYQDMDDKTATVVVAKPAATNETTGVGMFRQISTAAGIYVGNGDPNDLASFSVGMTYTSKGTNVKGQIMLMVPQDDGKIYVKSNSVSSMAVSGGASTIYTKASIFKIIDGSTVTIDGNVTLRMDVQSASPGMVGFTVLSSKDSTLYYSNSWMISNNAWRTQVEMVEPGSVIMIH